VTGNKNTERPGLPPEAIELAQRIADSAPPVSAAKLAWLRMLLHGSNTTVPDGARSLLSQSFPGNWQTRISRSCHTRHMQGNSINSDVSASGWTTASMMIGAVLGNDPQGFKVATSPAALTRWEYEALASLAAAAVAELAGHTGETPEAALHRLRDSFLAGR
jgi:hypothetical protein